jgi:hypothetical protein
MPPLPVSVPPSMPRSAASALVRETPGDGSAVVGGSRSLSRVRLACAFVLTAVLAFAAGWTTAAGRNPWHLSLLAPDGRALSR